MGSDLLKGSLPSRAGVTVAGDSAMPACVFGAALGHFMSTQAQTCSYRDRSTEITALVDENIGLPEKRIEIDRPMSEAERIQPIRPLRPTRTTR